MLLAAFCWLLVLPVAWAAGYLGERFLGGRATSWQPWRLMVGLALLTFYGQLMSLALPVNLLAFLPLLGLLGVYGLPQHRRALLSPLTPLANQDFFVVLGILALVTGGCLMKATAPSLWYDEGLYYQQTIRWVQEYGVVPGLGHVHSRFGFNSSWHVLAALLSFRLPGGHFQYNDINEIATLCFSFSLLLALAHNPGPHLARWGLLLGLGFLLVIPGRLSMPAADGGVIMVGLAMMTVFWLAQQKSEEEADSLLSLQHLLLAWLISIKLSAGALVLLPLAQAALQRRWVPGLRTLLPYLLLVVPFAIRGYIISGYPFYPLSLTAGHPDWQLPLDVLHHERISVKAFARLYNAVTVANPEFTMQQAADLPLQTWLPRWWAWQTPLSKGLIVLWPLCLLLSAPLALIRKNWAALTLVAVNTAGFLFWFFQAPDLRFAFAFVIPSLALPVALMGWPPLLQRHGMKLLAGAAVVFAFLCLDLRSLKSPIGIPTLYSPTVERINVPGGGYYNRPTTGLAAGGEQRPCGQGADCTQCWDAPLPCANGLKPGLRWRGAAIEQGFCHSKQQ